MELGLGSDSENFETQHQELTTSFTASLEPLQQQREDETSLGNSHFKDNKGSLRQCGLLSVLLSWEDCSGISICLPAHELTRRS